MTKYTVGIGFNVPRDTLIDIQIDATLIYKPYLLTYNMKDDF